MDVIPHIDFLEADWENVPNVIPMYVRMIIDRVNKSTKWIAEAKDAPQPGDLARKLDELQQQIIDSQATSYMESAQKQKRNLEKFAELDQEVSELKARPYSRDVEVQTILDTGHMHDHMSDSDNSENEHIQENDQNPRIFSRKTLNRFFAKNLKRSKLKKDFTDLSQIQFTAFKNTMDEQALKLDETIEAFKTEIGTIYAQLNHTEEQLKNLADGVNEGFSKVRAHGDNVDDQFKLNKEEKDDLESRFEGHQDLFEKLKSYTEQLEVNHNIKIAEVDARIDDIQTNQLDPALETVDNVVQQMSEAEVSLKKSTEDAAQEMLSFKQETMNNILDIQKTFTEFQNMQQQALEKYQKDGNDAIKACEKEQKGITDEIKKHIKDVVLEQKRMRMDYDSWITTTMEPAAVTEAKVFAVESRIQHEEKRRLEESLFIRDLVKKLIYSLEQIAMADELDKSSVVYMQRLEFVKQMTDYKPSDNPEGPQFQPPASRQSVFAAFKDL